MCSSSASRRRRPSGARSRIARIVIVVAIASRVVASSASRAQRAWKTVDAGAFQQRPCTVPKIDARDTSLEHFMRTFAASETPVVITGLFAHRSAFREATTRERMLQDYGDVRVTLSTANTFSYEKVVKSLREYIEEDVVKVPTRGQRANETLYWFGDHIDSEGRNPWSKLFAKYAPLKLVPADADVAYSFGIGGPMSGVPLHVHGPGWSETIIGRKHWFLAPPTPAPDFHPNVTAFQWASERLRRGRFHNDDAPEEMLECTVTSGEAIYFPNNWWHATLNLDESVFISSFVNYAREGAEKTEL
jgi:hypothetical protein